MSDVTVSFTPEFRRSIRRLARKYRNIRNDVQPIITKLTQGEIPGDQIQGIGHTVFKVRVKNSDAQRGKSGGYRIILLFANFFGHYSNNDLLKAEQGDISAEQIRRIIGE
ncbi:MAG: type II toxin-antitoxin system RelE/ParE family toxin [Bacteroidota bacterium]